MDITLAAIHIVVSSSKVRLAGGSTQRIYLVLVSLQRCSPGSVPSNQPGLPMIVQSYALSQRTAIAMQYLVHINSHEAHD